MKKFLVILASLLLMIGVSACVSCSSNSDSAVLGTDVEVVDSLFVEHTVALDRQSMFAKGIDNDYRWFETNIRLVNFLDEEYAGIDEVVNVFQTVESRDEHSFDTVVYKFKHTVDGVVEGSTQGFWIEDLPLNEEQITVTFVQALERVNEVNLPKPHSRYAVLRKPLGPKDCNAQWVFGNLHSQIWVDAVTGVIATSNPAFDGLNLGTPLGEWP